MSVIEKIKKQGLVGSTKIVGYHCVRAINTALYYFCWVFSINENLIVMESEGDLSDNAYALYNYMRNKGYLEKYRVVWLVDDVEIAEKKKFPSTRFVEKIPKRIALARSFYLATCRIYIYDHNNLLANLKRKKNKLILYLGHGLRNKAVKGNTLGKPVSKTFDFVLTTGRIPKYAHQVLDNCDKDRILELGYPRLDYICSMGEERINDIKEKLGFSCYSKIILWMPTFRQSKNKMLSEYYLSNETELPFLTTFSSIEHLNSSLGEKNNILVLKVHHLQKSLPIFSIGYTNIKFLYDNDIINKGVQLYEFIAISDALITDYSSIFADYLILNKPIIYTDDDYDAYNGSRGIWPSNYKDYLVGYHVENIIQLESALEDINNNIDKYKKDREKEIPQFHSHTDGRASERIIDFLSL